MCRHVWFAFFFFLIHIVYSLSLVLLSHSDLFHHFKTHIYTLFFFPFSLSYLYTQESSYYKYPFITLAVILSLQPFPVGLIKLTRCDLFSFEVSQLLKSLPAIHHSYKKKKKIHRRKRRNKKRERLDASYLHCTKTLIKALNHGHQSSPHACYKVLPYKVHKCTQPFCTTL